MFKMRGDALGASKAVIYLDTLLELVKLANLASGIEVQSDKTPEKQRELKWAVQGLKAAASKVEKLL